MCIQRQQLGIPLNEYTFASMTPAEEKFWHNFLAEAKMVITKYNEEGRKRPFTPPASLTEKYFEAIEKYHGYRYCQIHHLEKIFNFKSVQ